MRCKNCDYPLWQISARVCPECGAPFKPSEYEFTLNSVRFCCPHCEQDYYGTGPTGHLVPRSFNCVRCSKPIDMDDMVLLPTEGVQEHQTEVQRQPWLERGKRRGFFSALFATIGHSLVKPGQLLKATPPESGAWPATAFMLCTLGGLALVYGLFMLLFFGIIGGIASAAGPRGGTGVGAVMLGMGAGSAAGLLIFWLLILSLSAVVAHGILKITGGCAHGLGRTWQAFCYSSGANVASAVPCLGAYFGWIWWLVSGCIALKDAQKVHGGRAALAVLTVPILAFLSFIGFYIAMIVFAVSSASAFPTPAGGPFATASTVGANSPARIANLTRALRRPQVPITHIAEAIAASPTSIYDLMDTGDMSNGGFWSRMNSVPIGTVNLTDFASMPGPRQRTEARNAAAALPPNTIAYRLGDTVFTHPGIDVHSIPPGSRAEDLWLIIAWPETLASGTNENVAIGLAGGRTATFLASAIPAELIKQNELRADYGLPPLPDPASVAHGAPAQADEPPMLDLRKDRPKADDPPDP